jgi:hypothetical protein
MADSAAVTLQIQGWRYGMQFAERRFNRHQ